MKSIMFGIIKLLLAVVLVALLFIGLVYGASMVSADDHVDAERFCRQTPVGQPWAELARRIKASTADQRQSALATSADGAQSASVTFNSVFPLSRHVCVVQLREGRVSARANIFLD